MDKIFILLEEYLNQNDKLIEYIKTLQSADIKYYRENQEILYVGIVNRAYSLWETFCKNLIFEYYEKIKNQLLNNGELIHKLKLNELPGYIVEEGIIQNNRISYEIKKDYITYTSKNIEYEELKRLFLRFDVNVDELKSNKKIKEFLNNNSFYFGIEDYCNNKLKKAMKNLTEERNKVSHFSSIEEYQDLRSIIAWVQFCQLIAKGLSSIICKLTVEKTEEQSKRLGDYVRYLSKKHVLCIDISENVSADLKSIIYTQKKGKVKNIYRPLSFMVNDKKVDMVNENENAGIMLWPLVETSTSIDKADEIYVISE